MSTDLALTTAIESLEKRAAYSASMAPHRFSSNEDPMLTRLLLRRLRNPACQQSAPPISGGIHPDFGHTQIPAIHQKRAGRLWSPTMA
jgi:hypothetical protein